MKRTIWVSALIGISLSLAAVATASRNSWETVKKPSLGTKGPIGFYSAGCIDGAKILALDGPGFQVMRPSRNRYYGHDLLMDFVRGYGESLQVARLGTVLIGDVSQPRGGPMPNAHASHQIGLDLDIWFWLNPEADRRRLTMKEREEWGAPEVVDLDRWVINRDQWRPEHIEILRLVSERPEVERIFVNALIKKELCETVVKDRAWLHKIRPWWKHHEHFHVRLKCPEGAQYCRHQDAVPEGDGCGEELDWWLLPENHLPPTAGSTEPQKPLQMPKECDEVLNAPDSRKI